MDLSSMTSLITIGVFAVAVISLGALLYYLKKKKSSPLTPSSIPPLPSTGEANQHFATANVAAASSKKSKINRNTLIGLAVAFNVLLIGAILYVGSLTTQRQAIKSKAATNGSITVDCNDFKVRAGSSERIVNGNEYHVTYSIVNEGKPQGRGISPDAQPTSSPDGVDTVNVPIDVTVDKGWNYCRGLTGTQCQENRQDSGTETFSIPPSGSHTGEIVATQPDHQACGTVQADVDIRKIVIHVNPDDPSQDLTCNYGAGTQQVWAYNNLPDADHARQCSEGGASPTPTAPPFTTPPATSTPVPPSSKLKIWGRVVNIENAPPVASCKGILAQPGVPQDIANGRTVNLNDATGLTQQQISSNDATYGNGFFKFTDLPGQNAYHICIDKDAIQAAGYQIVCEDAGNAPGKPTVDVASGCMNVPVTDYSIGEPGPTENNGIRFVLRRAGSNITPSVPAPTCVPRPACLDQNPPCQIVPDPNWCAVSPTPKPTGPSSAPKPSITNSPTPTPTRAITQNSPTPTPTLANGQQPTIIVYITATPVPGTITDTPVQVQPSAAPTVPTVGSPLPMVAVIVPVILVALAFLL